MSIEALTWALTVPIGGNAKVVLLGLANHAHPDGTEAYPSKGTLASYAACDPSTAVRNVRRLEAEGWIERDGAGPHGEAKYRLAMGEPFPVGDGNSPPPAAAPRGDGTGDEEGVAPAPPEPSLEPSSNRPQGSRSAPAPDDWPDDLPAELHEPALQAGKILKKTALARGQRREVTRAAVGHAVLTHPDRDHVRVAREVEGWLLHGRGARKSCSDIVARFRSFLANADPIAAPPLAGAPRPSSPSSNISTVRAMADDLRSRGQ